MKKLTIILLLLFCAQNLYAQARTMRIHLNDGTELTYDVDSVSKMSITHEKIFPRYSKMTVDASSPTDGPFTYATLSIDSIKFERDSRQYGFMNMYGSQVSPAQFLLSFPNNLNSYIYSITFAEYENDTNVIHFPYLYRSCHSGFPDEYGDYQCAVWDSARIITTSPYRYIDIDTSYRIIEDITPCPEVYSGTSFALNKSGTKTLEIVNGNLYEFDVQLRTKKQILGNADSNVSGAAYFGDDSIIYYSYGSIVKPKDTSPAAGYYLLNRITGERTFLYHISSDMTSQEEVNGFDISPDMKKLLIPVTVNFDRMPYLIEYDLIAHTSDTLRIAFDTGNYRWGLWLRYNHEGSKILYSNYFGRYYKPYYHTVFTSSEIGIIDRVTLFRQKLHTDQTTEGEWVSLFPGWSPDDKHIVYCSGPMGTGLMGGQILYSQVCILKSLK